jgi:hypothetical protein
MVLFSAFVIAQAKRPTVQDVCFRLDAMEMQDQEVRERWITEMQKPHPNQAIGREVSRIDRQDTADLKKIIDQFGWPTIGKFGKKSSHTAWLIVQHADLNHPFQERCLALMKPLVAKKQVSGQDYAYLYDRVALAQHRKQLYGTQGKFVGHTVVLQPTEDRAHLDQRRRAVGLMPIMEYLKLMQDMYFPKKNKG